MGKVRDPLHHVQRSVFGWIGEDEGRAPGEKATHAHSQITVAEVAHKYGAPVGLVKSYMEVEIEQADSCASLPFTMMLVFTYAAMAIGHSNASQVNAVEDALSVDIAENANFAFSGEYFGYKTYKDVYSHADFYSWIGEGLVPLVFQQYWFVAESRNRSAPETLIVQEPIPRADRGIILNHNRMILGTRLQQERHDDNETECGNGWAAAALLQPLWGNPCVGAGYANEYKREPETHEARITTDPVKTEWLYAHNNEQLLYDKIEQLQREKWLDAKTRKLEVAIPFYNAEYGLHAMVYVNFFFSRGGHIWKEILAMTAYDNFYKTWSNYGFDFSWFTCLVYIILAEGAEVAAITQEYGLYGVPAVYVNFWNAVDWISVFSGILVVLMINTGMARTAVLNEQLAKFGNTSETVTQEEFREMGAEYVSMMEGVVNFYFLLNVLLSYYPVVIVLRLFKAFGAQPRLAMVTNTLKQSFVDICHFLVIFTSVFTSFAVASLVLFGREIREFMTPFRAFVSCFRIMLGDVDWDSMMNVGRYDSLFWYIPFVLIVSLVLLNVLIAIVMDAYSEVSAGAENSDPIWVQASKVWERWKARQNGDQVPLTKVLRMIKKQVKIYEVTERARKETEGNDEKMFDDAYHEEAIKELHITAHDLRKWVKNMRIKQAREIVEQSILKYYNENSTSADIFQLVEQVHKIYARTAVLKDSERNRLAADGFAKDHPHAVVNEVWDIYHDLKRGREELGTWLDEDPFDVPLPQTLLDEFRSLKKWKDEAQKAVHKKEPDHPMFEHVKAGAEVMVMDDPLHIIDACRKAGIPKYNDDLRMKGCGQWCRVLSRDAEDSSVRVYVPGVGLVWYSVNCFAMGTKDGEESTEATETEEKDRGLDWFEKEANMTGECVEEAVHSVAELRARFINSRNRSRINEERFEELRQRGIWLQQANRQLQDKIERDMAFERQFTSERDSIFAEVKVVVQENKFLEAELAKDDMKPRRPKKQP